VFERFLSEDFHSSRLLIAISSVRQPHLHVATIRDQHVKNINNKRQNIINNNSNDNRNNNKNNLHNHNHKTQN
jgi:hypothetical protein